MSQISITLLFLAVAALLLLGNILRADIVALMLMLALGLSVNTTVFSVVNGFLLQPLPFVEPEKLVFINETKLPDLPKFAVASGNFLDWQAQNTLRGP